MKRFRAQLESLLAEHGSKSPRSWLYVPYDQLSSAIGPLAREDPGSLGVVLVESPWKARRRPYHKRKLALVLANMRHFALEQAARGVAVRYVAHDGPYRDALRPLARELGPLRCMEPAERELRIDLAPLVARGALELIPHEGWLTTREDFEALGDAPWRMDAFYRHVRKTQRILVDEDGKPAFGKWSLDAENRKSWRGDPPAPEPPRFVPNEVTREVGELVERAFAQHPGELALDTLPATREDARALWAWAKRSCLAHFGPYEDAMSARSSGLFHTRVAAVTHLHRLLPRELIDDVLALDIPPNSKEGFVRQVLGWREFMHHVHVATDGFRSLRDADGHAWPRRAHGDAGWSRWSGDAWQSGPALGEVDDALAPRALATLREDAALPLPESFWSADSGLRCLDHVVASVWREGYSHHITRLMVLANLATLLGVDARELCDWFWVAYEDAYDWVVEPNVLGMGSYALGPVFTTKPYVSGAAYIAKMSDYCADCRYDPKKDCPITRLYWAFLAENAEALEGNPRVAMPLRSLARRSADKRREDAAARAALREDLTGR